MKTDVVVTGNDAGQVIIVSKDNSDYGYIRVKQQKTVISNKGWVHTRTLSALIYGTVEELETLNLGIGEVIPGKIVIKESLTPFNLKDPSADYKVAGKTGIVCLFNDQPIYRKCFYTPSDVEADELIAHENSEEIRLANQIEVIETVSQTGELDLEL